MIADQIHYIERKQGETREQFEARVREEGPKPMIYSTPAALCQKFMKIFGLRPGIKRLEIAIDAREATLKVEYFCPSNVDLTELEEFKIIPK